MSSARRAPQTAPHLSIHIPSRLFICVTLKFPRVPARVSEALVLRTYPLKEADLVVSFLTRDQGKLRGVAKRARRPKSAFGAGLERLSHVRMAYFQRETRELVNLDSCELIRSQFGLVSDYRAGVALDYFAEVTEQLLPSAEPNERFFRLLLAVLETLAAGRSAGRRVARRNVFFTCGRCGFRDGCRSCMFAWVAAACWTIRRDARAGVFQPRTGGSDVRPLPPHGRAREQLGIERGIAGAWPRRCCGSRWRSFRRPDWSQATAADLRRFLVQQIEAHVERQLVTAPVLEERHA